MIVQPDFLEHWKTRQLVELTGDESSPLCVIRLWAHCQNSKREYFPDMTPSQLASVCRWGNRKPACHVAMIRCKFVSKMSPKGYAAHEWSDHNRQLIQKWEAGKNGGRPKNIENTNELPLFEKPTDNRSITDRELDRLDRLELIDKRGRDSGKGTVETSIAQASILHASCMQDASSITIEHGLKWLAQWKKNGADYTEAETRSAFLALAASGWMWGRNPVTDYRAALERQIQTDRQRSTPNKSATNNRISEKRIDRSIGTANEGIASQYGDFADRKNATVGGLVKAQNPQ
jgi:hypothetical protein